LFDYIADVMADRQSDAHAVALVRSATLQRLPELVNANSERCARLIVECFTEDHNKVVDALGELPELQFQYLRAILVARAPSRDADAADDSRCSQE
jgi:hypothetical protein